MGNAANQCASEGCNELRKMPKPTRKDPSVMTRGSKYCKVHAAESRARFVAMLKAKGEAKQERQTKQEQLWAYAVAVLPAAALSYSGTQSFVRVAAGNTSFAYWLINQGHAVRSSGGGVVIPVAKGDHVAQFAGRLAQGLATLEPRARVTFTK